MKASDVLPCESMAVATSCIVWAQATPSELWQRSVEPTGDADTLVRPVQAALMDVVRAMVTLPASARSATGWHASVNVACETCSGAMSNVVELAQTYAPSFVVAATVSA
jgi:hypothetical protein